MSKKTNDGLTRCGTARMLYSCCTHGNSGRRRVKTVGDNASVRKQRITRAKRSIPTYPVDSPSPNACMNAAPRVDSLSLLACFVIRGSVAEVAEILSVEPQCCCLY